MTAVDVAHRFIQLRAVLIGDVARRIDLIAHQMRGDDKQPFALRRFMAGGSEQLADQRNAAEDRHATLAIAALLGVEAAHHQRAPLLHQRTGADHAVAGAFRFAVIVFSSLPSSTSTISCTDDWLLPMARGVTRRLVPAVTA